MTTMERFMLGKINKCKYRLAKFYLKNGNKHYITVKKEDMHLELSWPVLQESVFTRIMVCVPNPLFDVI